jgi:hypothetical protein
MWDYRIRMALACGLRREFGEYVRVLFNIDFLFGGESK